MERLRLRAEKDIPNHQNQNKKKTNYKATKNYGFEKKSLAPGGYEFRDQYSHKGNSNLKQYVNSDGSANQNALYDKYDIAGCEFTRDYMRKGEKEALSNLNEKLKGENFTITIKKDPYEDREENSYVFHLKIESKDGYAYETGGDYDYTDEQEFYRIDKNGKKQWYN